MRLKVVSAEVNGVQHLRLTDAATGEGVANVLRLRFDFDPASGWRAYVVLAPDLDVEGEFEAFASVPPPAKEVT